MDIGREIRTITVTPAENPVPATPERETRPAPARRPAVTPRKAPAKPGPSRTPKKEPVK